MNDYSWAHLMPDHKNILDNIGVRINLAELKSWPNYRPYRDWWLSGNLKARLKRLFWRIFKPQSYEYMRVQYEKWRFRYMQDMINAVLETDNSI